MTTSVDLPPLPFLPSAEERIKMVRWGTEIALAERERCAKLCDEHAERHSNFSSGAYSQGRCYAAEDLAAAIREGWPNSG